MFNLVDPKQSFPKLEEEILQYWQLEDTFKRSMDHRKENEVFSFYDGPPFATGLPHYGHLLAGTIKDVIPRYQTMRGKYVKRRFGWDCHGLPVENMIEKENKLLTKRDIESLGVKQFNDLCRAAVLRYTHEWQTTVQRMGRWVDMDWDYRTMDPDYMESIWWVFKQLYDKGLIYEGYKPMHICFRCGTPLSNFEVTQGYHDRTDYSVIVTFPLKDDPKTSILAWTTTPWSLPGNFFLAMGEDFPYVKVQEGDRYYIMAEPLVEKVFKGREYNIVEHVKAKDFEGKKYEPLFDYFFNKPVTGNTKGQTYGDLAYHVVIDDRVAVDEGTGIVHFASGYGEDGFDVGKKKGIGVRHHVTMEGRFTDEVLDFPDMEVKPREDPMSTDKLIAKKLKERGRLFWEGTITHSYPHCWRCDTPLLNYATSSWFVAVEKIKDKMVKVNETTEWVPDTIRTGRFGNWLDGARDWAISRSRYWGTPLPIWRNEKTGELEVLGSRDELMNKAPGRFTKVTVARHAQSKGNVDKIYQGKLPGTDLTAEGQKQAKALADQLAAETKPVSIIYHSPLARTTQTAQAVAKKLKVKLIADERLREVEFGEYEGKHIDFDDLAFIRARREHKFGTQQVESIYHFPGMETWDEMEVRTKAFLEDVLPKHPGEHILIVTHADVITNFIHLFTGLDKHKVVHQPYPNLAKTRTFYYDHVTRQQMDLHKETVDDIQWRGETGTANATIQLTLARHGQTEWNKQEKMQGTSDLPLDSEGVVQAEELAASLDPSEYDVILSSTLKRSKQTAEIIASKWEKDVISSPLFIEQNLGEWEGKTPAQILKEFPHYVADFIRHEHIVPGGENRYDFLQRVAKGREYLLKEYAGKRVLLVSHRRWMSAFGHLEKGEPIWRPIENTGVEQYTVTPLLKRIPDVLDCWFESGSMPYAQEHYPFESSKQEAASGKKKKTLSPPPGFPADFIAEGLDQTRGWFYTLTVLSTALFHSTAFKHCIVNGIVLAEDGKKMSKSLKNYPEPLEVVNKYGADSVRFGLMSSPAVRAEDLRFSGKLVEDTMRNVLLPLWNAYNLFVTYANAADWKAPKDFSLGKAKSGDALDQWIIAKTQDLVNRMTKELDGYDLSATCAQLSDSIDDLTNWYIRLNRRRFAGKGKEQTEAFDTLYRVLLANCQLLAPFCPFIAESIYLNLVPHEHGSIHFTDWPKTKALGKKEAELIALMHNTQMVVKLGLGLRNDAKVKVRIPLQTVTFALSPSDKAGVREDLIKEELNVKEVKQVKDPGSLATAYVQVDARKVGPRLGGKVQEIIKAGKAGQFEEKGNTIMILGEKLSKDEAKVMYAGAEGQPSSATGGLRPASRNVAADQGVVVSLDVNVSEELKLEGFARDIIRSVQKLRKDGDLAFTDTITLMLTGADDVLKVHRKLIEDETRSTIGVVDAPVSDVEIDERKIGIGFKKS